MEFELIFFKALISLKSDINLKISRVKNITFNKINPLLEPDKIMLREKNIRNTLYKTIWSFELVF